MITGRLTGTRPILRLCVSQVFKSISHDGSAGGLRRKGGDTSLVRARHDTYEGKGRHVKSTTEYHRTNDNTLEPRTLTPYHASEGLQRTQPTVWYTSTCHHAKKQHTGRTPTAVEYLYHGSRFNNATEVTTRFGIFQPYRATNNATVVPHHTVPYRTTRAHKIPYCKTIPPVRLTLIKLMPSHEPRVQNRWSSNGPSTCTVPRQSRGKRAKKGFPSQSRLDKIYAYKEEKRHGNETRSSPQGKS